MDSLDKAVAFGATGSGLPIAFVTGAASGIGLLTAVSLARAGMRVFASVRDLSRRAELDAAASAAGVALHVVELDVCRTDDVNECVRSIEASVGRIDMVVNNAGVGVLGFVEDLSLEEIRFQLDTNFVGSVAVIKAVLPGMLARAHGRIINVSSVGGRIATPGVAGYTASKFALEGFSEALHYELAGRGVHVSLIEPGMFRTAMHGANLRVARAAQDPNTDSGARLSRMRAWMARQAAATAGDPQRVADLIVHAATVERPKLRYPIGRDASIAFALKSLLPDSVFRWAGQKQLGMMIAADKPRAP